MNLLSISLLIGSLTPYIQAKLIRPEFGVSYTPVGTMYQGVEIYWLTIAMEIPTLDFPPTSTLTIDVDRQRFSARNCSMFSSALHDQKKKYNKANEKSIKEYTSELLKGLDEVKKDIDTNTYDKFKQILTDSLNNRTQSTQPSTNDALLHEVCEIILPSINQGTEDELAIQKEIVQIFEQDIPATLALLAEHTHRSKLQDTELGWNNYISELYGKIQRRRKRSFRLRRETQIEIHKLHKRQILGLLGLLMQGVNTAYSMHKEHSMKKSIELLERMSYNEFRSIKRSMAAVAKHQWEGFKDFQEKIEYLKRNQNSLAYWMKRVTGTMWIGLANAIEFLATATGGYNMSQHRSVVKHQAFKEEAMRFLSALDSLSLGHLSHAIISPYVLRSRLLEVKVDIDKRFPQYEMIFETLDQYYDQPLIQYEYAGGRTIAVQIPIPLKPKDQQMTHIYEIHTNFVPYNLDENENKPYSDTTFTKLNLDHDMMAVAEEGFEYIMLRKHDLHECMRIHHTFYCKDMFLVQHRTKDTCETALFWEEGLHVVEQLCKFDYYYDIKPPAELITNTKEIFLANVPLPWIFKCTNKDQPDNVITGHPYRIMSKTYLCNCSLEAGEYSIYNNPAYCSSEPKRMDYTTNAALYIHYKDKIPEYLHDFQFGKPLNIHFDEIRIYKETEEGIIPDDAPYIEEDFEFNMIPLDEVLLAVDNDEGYYKTKGDKALTMNNPRTWFSGENSVFGTLLMGFIISCVAIIIVIIIVFVIIKYGKTLKKYGHKYQLLPLVSMAAQGAQAQVNFNKPMILVDNVKWPFLELLGICIVIQTIVILICLGIYSLYKFIMNIYLTNIIDTKRFSNFNEYYSHMYLWIGNCVHEHNQLYIGSVLFPPDQIFYAHPHGFDHEHLEDEITFQYKNGWFIDTITIDYGQVRFRNGFHTYVHPDTLVYIPFWKRHMLKPIIAECFPRMLRLRVLYCEQWYPMLMDEDLAEYMTIPFGLHTQTKTIPEQPNSTEGNNEPQANIQRPESLPNVTKQALRKLAKEIRQGFSLVPNKPANETPHCSHMTDQPFSRLATNANKLNKSSDQNTEPVYMPMHRPDSDLEHTDSELE